MITKKEILYLIKLILAWAFLNVTLNMFGLWFTKLLNPAEFSYFESIKNEFLKPLGFQSLLFIICVSLAYLILKNKKIALYTFTAVQFIAFHVVFFLNIKIHHGMHFISTYSNLGMKYLSYCGQYLVDVLYLYFPINGNFDNGMFMPDNIGTFYLHWILLNILYYAGLTWLSIQTVKYFLETSPKTEKLEIEKEVE